jgi:hypothetical protein
MRCSRHGVYQPACYTRAGAVLQIRPRKFSPIAFAYRALALPAAGVPAPDGGAQLRISPNVDT